MMNKMLNIAKKSAHLLLDTKVMVSVILLSTLLVGALSYLPIYTPTMGEEERCCTVTTTKTTTKTTTVTDCTDTQTDCTATTTVTDWSTTTEVSTDTTTFTDCATTLTECTATTTITATEECYLGDGGLSNFGTIQCEGPNVIVGGTSEVNLWRKPTGTVFAQFIDATAAALMWGLCTDGVLYWDIDPTEVNQATGQTVLAGHEIMSGGPIVNGPVRYYEGNKIAPVYYKTVSGKANFFSTEGTPGTGDDVQLVNAELAWGEVGPSKDIFVVELFMKPGTIADPEYVVISYGYAGRGTLAASVWFKTVVEPNLSGFTDPYYIVQWDDDNSNGHPDIPGTDTYTVLYGTVPP
jgi:hypothetical protein